MSLSSPTTMMDPYDAQMTDYHLDMDIHMHTTVSSPRPWTLGEATMEVSDDIQPISTDQAQDVEVDMEPYYGEGPEYEMVDENEYVGGSGDLELVDVDVHDAPQDPDVQYPTDAAILPPSDPMTGDNHTAYAGAEVAASVEHIDTAPPHPSDSAVPAVSPLDADSPFPAPANSSHFENQAVHDDYTPAADDPTTRSSGVFALAPEEHHISAVPSSPHNSTYPLFSTDSNEGQESFDVPPSTSDEVRHDGHESAEGEQPSIVHIETSAPTDPSAPADGAPDQLAGEHVEGTNEEPESGDHDEHTYHQAEEMHHHEEHEVHDEDNADPLEIAEGVYIEPITPILLELPPSSDQPECYLLNAPPPSPGSHDPLVLLYEQPTLYFEELPYLFKALREEEVVQNIPGLIEGELVIDAFDLQLTISEDNIHAREASLYELNHLHDGSGLQGPLRLRLRSITPRFITRYNAMREQMPHPVDEGGVIVGEPEYHVEDRTQNESEHTEKNDDDAEATYEDDADPQEGQPYQEDSAAYDVSERDTAGDSEEQHGQDGTNPIHPTDEASTYHEVYGEDTHTFEQEEEYETIAAVNGSESHQPGEPLDVDGVHSVADSAAVEGTEYEEYTEAREEDDAVQADYADEDGETAAVETVVQGEDVANTVYTVSESTSPSIAQGDSESAPVSAVEQQAGDRESGRATIPPEHRSLVDKPDDDLQGFADDLEDENAIESVSDDLLSHNSGPAAHAQPDDVHEQNPPPQLEEVFDDDGSWDQDDEYDPDLDEPLYEHRDVAQTSEVDTVSTESSTLSSKTSSKRTFDEVEPEQREEESATASPTASPNSKRTRVT